MVTILAVGKVEHGGPVQITTAALPNGADHPVNPVPDEWERGRQAYLFCLEAEGCPADWADDPQFWMRPSIESDYEDIRRGN